MLSRHCLFTIVLTASLTCAAQTSSPHVIELTKPVLCPDDGLLLGNGDLSVSVYETTDRIIWRFGKGDIWDRRLDLSDDPAPVHIDELARGIEVEGWKCGPYGGPVEALHGAQDPERMKAICQGAPPSYTRRPYPCPKPVGEFALQLPPDQMGFEITQRLVLDENVLYISGRWASGLTLELECAIPPDPNVLIVHWKLSNWTPATRTGNVVPPIWFMLYRWPDPDMKTFAARFQAEFRHDGFRPCANDKTTPLPPPRVIQDGNFAAIEQTFPPENTFPQGFSYLFAPIAPGVQIQHMDMSPDAEARFHLMPSPDATEGWLAIAVTTTLDQDGSRPALDRIRAQLETDAPATLAQWLTRTRETSQSFWAQSSVAIDDTLLEDVWRQTLHARRCAYRAGKVPPGLMLPSTIQDFSHWHGDYHTNYNIQEPFWGDYTANHLELGDAYFDAIAYFLPIGQKIARDYYNTRGVFIQLSGYPINAQDDPLGIVPMGRMAYMTGWAANQYWWRYLYTLDDAWLRNKGYPVIRDCALFYTDFLKKGADGLYHAFPSNQGEDGFTGNPKDYTDRPQIMQHMRYCLRAAIQASEILALDEDLRAQWRDRLDNAAGDDGNAPLALEGLARLCQETNPPEFGFGRPYAPQPENPNRAPWPAQEDGFFSWYFGQYPWSVMQRIRGGEFIADLDTPMFRRMIERWRHPNGLVWGMAIANYGHAGAWTESLGLIAPLQEMMLQSWDGALRIFPAWPRNINAQFDRFRAQGAFLVNAAWAGGRVATVTIHSEKGHPCTLYSPWPQGFVVKDEQNQAIPQTQDPYGRPQFPTTPGGEYTLTPQ